MISLLYVPSMAARSSAVIDLVKAALHRDHVGAQVAEDLRGERAHHHRGQVEHPHAVRRSLSVIVELSAMIETMGHIEPAHKSAFWNPFANMAALAGKAITIVGGEGCTVYDADGRAYLDALASLWYCNVGYGRAELAEAADAQMREIAGFQTFEYYTNPPADALCTRIADLVPMSGAKVFLTPGGGSDAVDTAGKLARAYWRAVGEPNRQVIISRSHAYHGMNAYGTSLGGIPLLTEAFTPLVSHVEQVPWDDPTALEKTIEMLGKDRVAAFFCEPVIGAGGVYPPPEGYLRAVREICRRHNVLFVADEVITGYGRVGTWFASERFGLDPDVITSAKGLSSGYLPIGAVIVGPRVAEPFWQPGATAVFRHGYTYSGHPAAAAAHRAGEADRARRRARAGARRDGCAAQRASRRQRGQVGDRTARCRRDRRGPPGRRPGDRAATGRRRPGPRRHHQAAPRCRAADLAALRDHRGGARPDHRGLRRRVRRGQTGLDGTR